MRFLKWTCLVLLLIMVTANNSIAWETWLKTKDIVIVYDVTIEKETDPAYLQYTNFDKVALGNPKINSFTVEMQSQITNVRRLELTCGAVPTVHVAPQFKEFSVQNCSTSNVIINPNITYSLELLGVNFNILEKLPKHLNAMKKLKSLYLHDNQIEFVDMADFNGLNNLQKIHLSRNKILEISANPVVLPSLFYFIVEDNRLSSINFEYWNATSLKHVYLSRNRLSILLSFPSKFPSLTGAALDENPFNCQWLNVTLKELNSRKVTVWDKQLITCSKVEEALDELRRIKFQNTFATKQEVEITNNKLSLSTTHNLKKLQDSLIQLQKTQQQTKSELEKSIQDYKRKIGSLEQFQKFAIAEIEQLKHKDDDLTEALYLHEIEVTHKNASGAKITTGESAQK